MTAIAVIPARFGSTRFPGKPLACDTGKFLIQHVVERIQQASSVDRVLVATDDKRIADAVTSFGGEVRMTRDDHPTGTERVGEVVEELGLADEDIVLNVQGDEPDIPVWAVDRLVEAMTAGENACPVGTLAAGFDDDGPTSGPGSPLDPNCVKVVVDAKGQALYFSRSVIPFDRARDGAVDRPSRWLLHLGVYAFRVGTLRSITGGRLPHSVLEETEALEQLRWLEHGLSISVVIIESAFAGIDTPDDYAAFVERVRSRSELSNSANAVGNGK